MRISRAPVPQSATRSNDSNDPGEKQAGTPDGDLVQLPEWQRAFVLGPNVRFTRTPESAMTRKGNGQPVADDAIDETLAAIPVAEPVSTIVEEPHTISAPPEQTAPGIAPVPEPDAENAPLSL